MINYNSIADFHTDLKPSNKQKLLIDFFVLRKIGRFFSIKK